MKKSLSKAWILLVTFVIAFCFIVPTASAAAEPTKLPIFWGFEDPEGQLDVPELMLDYHGFMHDGNGASEIQSKVVYEGKYAMKCDAKDLVWGMVLAPTLQKGKTYIFSVYIKTEDFKNNNGYNLYSRVKRPVEMYLSDSLRLEDGTADWKKYEIKFKALQDGLVDLGIQPFEAGAKPTGILYFDNIELKEEGGSTNSTAAPTTKAPTTKAPSTKAPTTAVVQPTATDTATTESSAIETTDTTIATETNAQATAPTGTTTKDATPAGNTPSAPWGWIIAGIVVVLAAGGGVTFWLLKKKKVS